MRRAQGEMCSQEEEEEEIQLIEEELKQVQEETQTQWMWTEGGEEIGHATCVESEAIWPKTAEKDTREE